MNVTYCIYVLVDPDDPENYRYCGYTKNRIKRLEDHIQDAKIPRGNITHKINWIRSLMANNKFPSLIVIQDNIPNEQFASALEVEYYHKFLNEGHRLTNTASPGKGGDTYSNNPNRDAIIQKIRNSITMKNNDPKYKQNMSDGNRRVWLDPAHRHKMSLLRMGELNGMYDTHRYGIEAPMFGKRHTNATKKKIGDANRGKVRTEMTRMKMSKSRRGKPKSHESVRKHFKSVLQYDLNMGFLNRYESIKQAATMNGIHASGISACCAGRLKSSGKYIWRYGDYENCSN